MNALPQPGDSFLKLLLSLTLPYPALQGTTLFSILVSGSC
ncbi:hypothetical protein AVDCRST_MAG94-3000 [uncultured Leptolyngbya sp.]|uniref:Uncharacterized protein n=1 Tax=uncultured Leptolyngbya sp. TaxID=332963 RepID=A0A6J4MBC3_9CYAN|nr:hypothetical protein AVDCRST_MAG94-3000 [uncultured Leptolyngbya sp.]